MNSSLTLLTPLSLSHILYIFSYIILAHTTPRCDSSVFCILVPIRGLNEYIFYCSVNLWISWHHLFPVFAVNRDAITPYALVPDQYAVEDVSPINIPHRAGKEHSKQLINGHDIVRVLEVPITANIMMRMP